MDKEDIKELISLCSSFEEADFIISEYGDFNSTKEKNAFLKEFFPMEVNADSLEEEYKERLKAFVKSTRVR